MYFVLLASVHRTAIGVQSAVRMDQHRPPPYLKDKAQRGPCIASDLGFSIPPHPRFSRVLRLRDQEMVGLLTPILVYPQRSQAVQPYATAPSLLVLVTNAATATAAAFGMAMVRL